MELLISSFKILKNKKYLLPKHGLVLLNGKSGIGKSTLLNSIMFCINNYQGRFVGEDANININFDGLLINRQKKPNRLFVHLIRENLILNDQEAQNYLNLFFHIEYITQSNFDWFLISSQIERKQYLEKLAGFMNEKTCTIENILLQTLKTIELEIVQNQSKLTLLKDQLNNLSDGILINEFEILKLKNNLENEIVDIRVKLELFKKQQKSEFKNKLIFEISNLKPQLINLQQVLKNFDLKKNKFLHIKLTQELLNLNCNMTEQELVEKRLIFNQFKSKRQKCEQVFEKFKKFSKPEFSCKYCNQSCNCIQNLKSIQDNINSNGKRTWEEEIEFNNCCSFLNEPEIIFDEFNFNQEIKKIERKKELEFEIKKIGDKWEQDVNQKDLDLIQTQIDELKIKQNLLDKLSNQLTLLNQELENEESIIYETDQEEELKKKLKEKNDHLTNLNQSLKEFEKFQRKQELKQKFESIEQVLKKLINEKQILKNLNKVWKETKQEKYENLLKNIENGVNNILNNFFQEPITINLLSNEKQEIELQIFLNNKKLHLNDLSGGEKSRLSLAFTCTLSLIRNGKILLLDEACSGLDYDNFLNIVDFLKDFSTKNNILIIFVSHQTNIENFFNLSFTI